MPQLDGTEKLTHTPFDSLDKQVQSSDPKGSYDAAGNWIPDAEFPKAVDHVTVPAGHVEPVVVEDYAEERDFLRKKVAVLTAEVDDLKTKLAGLAAAAKEAADHAAAVEAAEQN